MFATSGPVPPLLRATTPGAIDIGGPRAPGAVRPRIRGAGADKGSSVNLQTPLISSIVFNENRSTKLCPLW